jgi:hypothetical protein
MAPPEIDMTGRVYGPFLVVERAPSQGRGARWFVLCLVCKAQRDRSGDSLRRGRWLRCEECGA